MQFNKEILIGDKIISENSRAFIIAEAGVNHNGDIKVAKQLIDIAVEAGADAVKFQAFKTENLILKNVEKAKYQKKTTDSNESQYEMLKRLELTKKDNRELLDYCDKKEIIFLTTPFDEESLDELDSLNLAAYKVASTDATNLPFLRRIARKNKPIILSTGMCYMSEVEYAIREIFTINRDVILLQCTANYPINDSEANLNVMNTYREAFNILIGYSDHTIGLGAGVFSVVMGAKVIEKHFTIDKTKEGPDHKASLSPEELKLFVETIRRAEAYLGNGIKEPTNSELGTRKALQKCIVAKKDIKKGDQFSINNITAKRTGGFGISPLKYRDIIDTIADRNYKKDDIIKDINEEL